MEFLESEQHKFKPSATFSEMQPKQYNPAPKGQMVKPKHERGIYELDQA